MQAPQSDIFTQSYDDDAYVYFLATDIGNQVLVPVIEMSEQPAPENEESADADAEAVGEDIGKILLIKIPAAGSE